MSKAAVTTYKHISRVRQLLGEFAIEMIKRGDRHDASKFDPIEMGPLEEMQKIIESEGQAPFGSEEYARRTEFYEFENGGDCMHGINGMDLFDLVEMFFDWKAASERGEESAMNLNFACDKYKVEGPLRHILFNTAERLGYRTK